MNIKNIKDPSIAKEKFDYRLKIKEHLPYERWVEFINSKSDYFTWLEDTVEGKETLKNIEKIPESFREGVLKGHNKLKACAEKKKKKGYYEFIIQYNKKFGHVSTTFMKPIEKEHLKLLLEMAKYLDAYLLNNGTEIIDENVLNEII